MLNILEKFVKDNGYTYLTMDGGVLISARQPLITQYNNVSCFRTDISHILELFPCLIMFIIVVNYLKQLWFVFCCFFLITSLVKSRKLWLKICILCVSWKDRLEKSESLETSREKERKEQREKNIWTSGSGKERQLNHRGPDKMERNKSPAPVCTSHNEWRKEQRLLNFTEWGIKISILYLSRPTQVSL